MNKVSTEPISDLSFIEGVNLTDEKFSPEELLSSEQVIAQYLSDYFPSIDFFEDSTVYDVVVRPASVIYLVIRRMLETFQQTSSVKDIQDNPELADAAVVEAILSNYLISLNSGSPSRGVIKLQVARERTYRLQAGLVFTTSTGMEYTLDESIVTTTGEAGSGQVELYRPDSSQELWIFYVPVTAVEAGSIYNVAGGTEFSLETPFNNLIRASANLDFSGGTEGEGFEDLENKILNSLSARNMVSRASIFSSIRDALPQLIGVSTQGMGDTLIFRNRNTLVGLPVGGIVDVYVRTSGPPVFTSIEKTATKVSGTSTKYALTISRDDAPGHYFIRSIRPRGASFIGTYAVDSETRRINAQVSDGGNPEVRPNIINEVIEGTYSRWQETDVIIDVQPSDIQVSEMPGELKVDVEVFNMPYLKDIQDMIAAPDVRVAGTDFLVRGFVPAMLGSSEIRVRVASKSQVSVEQVRSSIMAYVHSIPPGYGVRVDDIVTSIKGVAGVITVDLPIEISIEVYCPDAGMTVARYSSRSVLDVPTDTTLGIGPSNTAFFVEPGMIPITISE